MMTPSASYTSSRAMSGVVPTRSPNPAIQAAAKQPVVSAATNPVDVYESQDGSVTATRDGVMLTNQTQTDEFRDVLHRFIGTTMYGQMLKSMRATQSKPAYFDGGRAEEMFQMQLDQVLVDKMTAASPKSMTSAMYDQMNRKTIK